MIIAFILAATVVAAPPVAETDAIFAAAGAQRRGKDWILCPQDRAATARIDLYRDLNGDGRTDVIVVADSAACYGAAGRGFALVSRQPNGRWRRMIAGPGMAEVLDTKGVGGWPDITISGPGSCFPVMRWNGRAYGQTRRAYLGKPCR